MTIDFKAKGIDYQQRINRFLSRYLQENYSHPEPLISAISYSLLAKGKRIRPQLTYASAEALGLDLEQADHIAASIEMIHAYSLIHDDLPAMDDDDLRRGQATCHVKFDEATAILAGDALQAMAFEVLSFAPLKAQTTLKLILKLSQACGIKGMVGGQALDLCSENKQLNKMDMDEVHQLKTGAIISASVEMIGLLLPKDSTSIQEALKNYAYHFGMAFQIIDDVLDVIGDEKIIGKPVGSDESNHKSTYPAIMGLEKSKDKAIEHVQNAIAQLQHLPNDSSYLEYLAHYLISRNS